MKVLTLSLGQDTAGTNYRIAQAFERHAPDIQVTAMHAKDTYHRYPFGERFDEETAQAAYDAADVVQLTNGLHAWHRYDHGQGKPTVVYHHGTTYRGRHVTLDAEALAVGATQLVSTVDLEALGGPVRWVPILYDLDALRAIRRREYRPSNVIRIAHAPTNRAIKGTRQVIDTVRQMRRRGYPVELRLIEGKSWAECLIEKARCDILVDQFDLGYGCNAIEAWAMGMPVVAGVRERRVRARMLERWGRLPFLMTPEPRLYFTLRRLIRYDAARRRWAAIGEDHVERFHDERRVVPLLADVYRSAKPTKRVA